MQKSVHGILLLDKPAHITSNGILQRVKYLFCAKKAGHTGSLDPLATGMLPLCFGEATKFSQFLLDANKSYYVVAKLGIQTKTGDSEGEVIATRDIIDVTTARLEAVLATFLGESEQIPPMYSAIKHQGKPLYQLARRGLEVERQPRKITIFSLTLESFNSDEVAFRVQCTKGTYIRTLVEDMGHALGCGAHVIGLRRLAVAAYTDGVLMHTISALEAIVEKSGHTGLSACLLPIETAVAAYPAVQLSTAAAFYLRMGQPVRTSLTKPVGLVRLLAENGKFLGMGEMLPDCRVKPHRLVSAV